MEQRA